MHPNETAPAVAGDGGGYPQARARPLGSPRRVQGYVDQRSTDHVLGWMRNPDDPNERLIFEVVLCDAPEIVIAQGVADRSDPALLELGVGDGSYGFRVAFDPSLSPADRDRLIVRARGSADALELAPALQGYVDERSTRHVAGWVRDRHRAERRVQVEAVLPRPEGEVVLCEGPADCFNAVLGRQALGDGFNGFRLVFPAPLSVAERDRVSVRPKGEVAPLPLAPRLATAFEPIGHLAMDITNNCNLRCPFCVYDYEGVRKTMLMTRDTFAAALRLIPYVTDGNFWLSCLHEATMHPELMDLIETVPEAYRSKVMYTTNLARPMPERYFSRLAASGLHHINVSLESFNPELYERMRQGARWGIFEKNLAALTTAFARSPSPPKLRYNLMGFRSNVHELPDLVRVLLNEKLGAQVEIRHMFSMDHIPREFRRKETLARADWDGLQAALADVPESRLILVPPPAAGDGASIAPAGKRQGGVPYPLRMRMEWDGKLVVYDEWTGPNGMPAHKDLLVTNINLLRDAASIFGLL